YCLGRQFAKLGHGLSNRDRGRAIRVLLSLEEDRPYEEPALCQLCLGNLPIVDRWAERARAALEGIEFKKFVVGSHLPDFLKEQEQELQRRYDLEHAGELKHDLNREVGKLLEAAFIEAEVDLRKPEVAVLLDLVWDRVELVIKPLFIFGRYRKLVRGLPQTHWPCRRCRGRGCPRCNFTGKQYPESVEELISPPLLAAARGSSSAFHGSGREDIDARMLGQGRPFVVEIREPKIRTIDLKALEEEINRRAAGKVDVQGLRFTEREMVERLKASRAAKLYRARVEFERPVGEEDFKRALEALVGPIEQRTPRRVAHRRADRVRRRTVHEINGELLSDREALIEVRCDGGLYVKELISGDEGRTSPNLATVLGVPAEIRELDVLEVFDGLPRLGEFADAEEDEPGEEQDHQDDEKDDQPPLPREGAI
ncbi:MAG: tRNA pseudouridine(54/55) synthase Pus10, partial [Candidatus Bipolaricaulia bacterium]